MTADFFEEVHAVMGIIGGIIIGGIAGWLAGKIMTGRGFGIIWDVILGVVAGFLGSWILGAILGILGKPGFHGGVIVQFVTALVAACILVGIVHLIKREPIRSA